MKDRKGKKSVLMMVRKRSIYCPFETSRRIRAPPPLSRKKSTCNHPQNLPKLCKSFSTYSLYGQHKRMNCWVNVCHSLDCTCQRFADDSFQNIVYGHAHDRVY